MDEPTNKLVIPFSHSSSTKPQTSPPQVKTSSEDDHPGDNISITRSDGITHDILSVFQKPGINEVINTSTKAEYSPVKSPEPEEDHGRISITRSDGVTHDIVQVFKATSDGHNETVKIKSRNPSVGKIDVSGLNLSGINLVNSSSTAAPSTINLQRENTSIYYPKHVRIVHFSDTHNFLQNSSKLSNFLPHGDILVHTGNFTASGKDEEFVQFNEWLGSVSDIYHYRVVILGHRDVKVYGNNFEAMRKLLSNATHLVCHEEVVVLGIRFYGVPWNWGHKVNFTIRPGAPATTNGRFDDIPSGIHVLLTHAPAYDRLDTTYSGTDSNEHWGSRELLEAIRKVRPGLHLHGHVKDSRGVFPAFGNNPLTVNSSMVDKDCSVLYATPHVIQATQSLSDKSNKIVTWMFQIASLEG